MRQRLISQKPGTDLPDLFAALRRDQREPQEGRSWYAIRNISREEAEVFIYDEIGSWGVTASDFLNELASIKASAISLRINSPGGDVFDGIAIYNAIRRQDATVNVFVDGLAASAASFVAMSGDTVTMSPKSQLMIHDAWGFAMGPAEDMRKMAEMLDKTSENIASIYADKAGGSVDEWRERMRAETWFSDREAVDLGLADGIDGEEPQARLAPAFAALEVNEDEPAAEDGEVPVDYEQVFNEIVKEQSESLFAEVGG